MVALKGSWINEYMDIAITITRLNKVRRFIFHSIENGHYLYIEKVHFICINPLNDFYDSSIANVKIYLQDLLVILKRMLHNY